MAPAGRSGQPALRHQWPIQGAVNAKLRTDLAAPNATVVTNALTDRRVSFMHPPSYDSPSTIAMYDHSADALFSADSFGTVLPEMVDNAIDADQAGYLAGMAMFTRANAPWTALADQHKWDRALAEFGALNPRNVLSSHAPTASARTRELLETVRAVPAMDPWMPEEDLEVEAVLARYEA